VTMERKELSFPDRLAVFQTARNRVDRFLLHYGPLAVLIQVILTALTLIIKELYLTYHPDPEDFIWLVSYPLYIFVMAVLLVEAFAIRNFLGNIPKTFLRLWRGDSLAIKGKNAVKATAFLDVFEKRLNSPQHLAIGLPLILLGLFGFLVSHHIQYLIGKWFDGSDIATKLVVTVVYVASLFGPTMLVGYTAGLVLWKMTITAIHIYGFNKDFELVIQSSHPDRAGGLKPLGDLIFSVTAILVIASLALSGLIILSDYYFYTLIVNFYSKVFLTAAIALSLIVFFLPLLSAHEKMLANREKLEPMLVKISNRIRALELSTQTDVSRMNHKQRKEIFEEIDSLTNQYRRLLRIPVWPFDRDILLRFLTPQVFSVLSLVGIAEPVVAMIRSFVQALTGN
jgi:hypothetical protein